MEPLKEVKSRKEELTEMFVKLVDMMVDPEHYQKARFIEMLQKIAVRFRLSKGVTEFYKSISDEKEGKGEVMIDHDTGHSDVVVWHKRFFAQSGAILKATAYMAKDEAPLDEEEMYWLDLMYRSVLSFLSRKRLQDAIEELAFHDEFGYPNFTYYFRYITRLNAETGSGLFGYTAAMINLRQFTIINRDLGRDTGDMVMKAFYEVIKETLGSDGLICRVGGDNFAAIFKNELLDGFIKVIEGTPITYDESNDRRVMVSACAGIFIIPSDYVLDRPGNIVDMIYPACQQAKMAREGTIQYASKKSVEEKEKNARVRRHFEEGLIKNEFQAYYQPKVDVKTGKIVGAEALCRWISGSRVIPPMEFIPVLEQNTDICRLDFYMLDHVCKDIRRWLDEKRDVVRVSVNLSRKHLIDVDLLEHLMRIIEKNKVPYKYIEIELTETTTEVEFKKLRRLVEGLQEAGISTAVDDFGVGYSSLNLIRELPWNVLKIDRGLLPGVGNDNRKMSTLMYKHIASMAKDMGLECITEGVETQEQVEVLKLNDCPYAQGFFFDQPLPVKEFEKRLDIGGYF